MTEKEWAAFLSRQDMIWTAAPEKWEDGAFIGNGRMGAMIYRDPADGRMMLELGRNDIYDNRDEEAEGAASLFSNERLPVGRLYLRLKGQMKSWKMRLDLWGAALCFSAETTAGSVAGEIFACADRQLIAGQFQTSGSERAEWEFVPAVSESPRQAYGIHHQDPARIQKGCRPNPPARQWKEGDICFALQELSRGAGIATAFRRAEEGKYLYLETCARECSEDAAAEVRIMAGTDWDFEELKRAHRRWWADYYRQSFVTLPDGRMESFYWIQMYKLASAARKDSPVMDNQGPWLTETAWPGTWWNLNVQLAYSPCYTANRLEIAESLWRNLQAHAEELRWNVPEECGGDAMAIHTTTTRNFRSKVWPIEEANRERSFAEAGNLLWALYDCWLHYRMKMDDSFLKEFLFPMLRAALQYYIHYLKKEGDGKYHIPCTTSPEYGTACEDCNYDLSLLKWGLSACVQAAERLGQNEEEAEKWSEILEDLTEYPADEDGLLIGRHVKYERSHRHYSHLLMIYPLHLLNKENGNEELIRKSLEWWQSKPEELRGFSYTGAASVYAALGEGDPALKALEQLWGKFLKPNTMYMEEGPVIETPLSAAQTLQEFLLQSWGGKIRIFPAMPSGWRDAAFENLAAEGGFLVSAARKNGKTVLVRLKSLAGEPLRLAGAGDLKPREPEGCRIYKTAEGDWFTDNLAAGEEISFFCEGEETVLEPVEQKFHKGFRYGISD